MKRSVRLIVACTCCVWICLQAFGAEEKSFKGEIEDSQCALNVHSLSQSHKEMIGMTPSIKTDAECVRYCVKERGGRFVLQAKGKVYKLDRQDLAEQNVGGNVKVTGTLDPKTGIVAVQRIESLPDKAYPATAQNKPKE